MSSHTPDLGVYEPKTQESKTSELAAIVTASAKPSKVVGKLSAKGDRLGNTSRASFGRVNMAEE